MKSPSTQRTGRKVIVRTAALLAALAAAAPALAQDLTWDGSIGKWFDASRWLPGGTEPTSSNAVFIQNGTVEVTATGEQANTIYIGQLLPASEIATLIIRDQGHLTNGVASIARATGSSGYVEVNGAGSIWTNTSDLDVGRNGNGELLITNGGSVSNVRALIGRSANGVGTATVTGSGSTWNSFAGLWVGDFGNGTLNISSGGAVMNTAGYIGRNLGSTGSATVGTNSTWTNTSVLEIGESGTGTLMIQAGGTVSNTSGIISRNASGNGSATVDGNGSSWINTDNLSVGNNGTGSLVTTNGGSVYVGDAAALNQFNGILIVSDTSNVNGAGTGGELFVRKGSTLSHQGSAATIGFMAGEYGYVTVEDGNSEFEINGALVVGASGTGTLNVQDGGRVENTVANIGEVSGSTGTVTVTGTGSIWANSSILAVGNSGSGTLNVEDGGRVENNFSNIGDQSGSTGTATVTGTGSIWDNSSVLFVGDDGTGTLNVEAGGRVESIGGVIGRSFGSTGTAMVTGPGSIWANSSGLTVGDAGTGTLNIEAGGRVESIGGVIGGRFGSTGTATVTGPGSIWANSSGLTVGSAGTGTLNIESNGLVTVGGTTSIGTNGAINIDGGRLEFGAMSLADYAAINGISGSLAGDVAITGFNDMAGLSASFASHASMDVTDVNAVNAGLLFGNGVVGIGLTNTASGQADIASGERMIFAGGLDNAGTLNNAGGQFFFEGAATNQAGGSITGRGQFNANGGWTNDGDFNFSGGFADVRGDVELTANGSVFTAGSGVTTFFDDLIHNGTEIRTEAGSTTVVFGLASGGGDYTGSGLVQFVGGVSLGNSPAEVNFSGDVSFTSTSDLLVELGGTTPGTEYDVMNVAGTFTLDGELNVVFIDGFTAAYGDSFDIINAGSLVGSFDTINLAPLTGDLTWELDQTATGISLTAVPEPSTLPLLAMGGLLLARRRRRAA